MTGWPTTQEGTRMLRNFGVLSLLAVACLSSIGNAQCNSCSACGEEKCVPPCEYGYRGAIAAPLGTYNHGWQCGQIRAAHEVISVHRCDWVGTSSQLSDFAKRYLHSTLNNCLGHGQILVEPSGEPWLDEERRQSVMNYLSSCGLVHDCELVQVGYGTRDRLRGDDASRVLDNFGYQTTRAQTNQFNPFIGTGIAPPPGNAIPPGFGALPTLNALPGLGGIFAR